MVLNRNINRGTSISRRLLGDVWADMNKVFDTGMTEGILPMNIVEYDESYKIDVAVPGYTRDEMTVKVENGNLMIKAEKEKNEEESAGNFLYRGITSYNFNRTLPNVEDKFKVDCTQIVSSYEQGILSITLPKKISALPQTVDIQVK